MKKIIFLSIILLISINTFSQSVKSIVERVSNEICDCVGDIKDKSELKKKLKECSDDKINFIMNNSTKAENKVLLEGDNLKKVITQIEPSVLTDCENVRKIIKKNLDNETDKVSVDENINPFPTNFTEKDFKKIKKWKSKIVALDGEVIQVEKSRQNTPYSKLKIGDKEIWIISMIDSGFEKVGNKLRIVGYLMEIDSNDNEFERKIHKEKYHILTFGIVNLENKQLAYFPGSEMQIKEWMNGKIPSSEK